MPLGFSIGAISYPVMVIMLLRKQSGPISRFLQAGAVSPETARRPESLKLYPNFLLRDAVKGGTLVALADGRFHVDVPVYRRKRRNLILVLAVIGAIVAAAAVALWWHGF